MSTMFDQFEDIVRRARHFTEEIPIPIPIPVAGFHPFEERNIHPSLPDHRRNQIQSRPHLGHHVVRRYFQSPVGDRAAHLSAVHQAAGRAAHPEGAQGRPHRQTRRRAGFQLPTRSICAGPGSRRPRRRQMFATVRDEVFPFIKTLGRNGGGDGDPDDSTYTTT
jgi:hypothetical protein